MLMRGLEVKARGRDLLAQSDCRLAGEVAVAGRVELPQHLHIARRGASARVVGPGRVEPRPQEPRDLLAVEQLGRHALRFELCAQRVDVGELLAHRPTVRAHRPLQRRRSAACFASPTPVRLWRRSGAAPAARPHSRRPAPPPGRRRAGAATPPSPRTAATAPTPADRVRLLASGWRPGAGLHLPPAVRQQLARGSPASRRCRSARSPRRQAARPAARTPRRSSPARPRTSAAGSDGVTRKIRTSAPSLVTISPVRSIASTANSSPACGRPRPRPMSASLSIITSPSRCL